MIFIRWGARTGHDQARAWLFALLLLCAGPLVSPAHAEHVRDLAAIQGVRSNPLIGYGLVVGLDRSGD